MNERGKEMKKFFSKAFIVILTIAMTIPAFVTVASAASNENSTIQSHGTVATSSSQNQRNYTENLEAIYAKLDSLMVIFIIRF